MIFAARGSGRGGSGRDAACSSAPTTVPTSVTTSAPRFFVNGTFVGLLPCLTDLRSRLCI